MCSTCIWQNKSKMTIWGPEMICFYIQNHVVMTNEACYKEVGVYYLCIFSVGFSVASSTVDF